MTLWGNKDNVASTGTVSLNYDTGVVTGSGSDFAAELTEGQIIRFGDRSGTYFGDAVIKSIASATSLTIVSTTGLSGAAIAATSYQVSELPKYSVGDSKYSESASGTDDSYIYGVAAEEVSDAAGTQFEVGSGWVGVTTYMDTHGNLRVKKEVLVAMSGISTGNLPLYPPA